MVAGKGHGAPYTHGDDYGHVALAVPPAESQLDQTVRLNSGALLPRSAPHAARS